MIGQVRQPEMGDQALVPFTMAVVHEVQCFGDIIALGLPHMTSRDIEVQGFLIPKVGLRLSSPQLGTTCHLVAPMWALPGGVRTAIQATQSSFPQALNVPGWVGVRMRAEAGLALSIQSP